VSERSERKPGVSERSEGDDPLDTLIQRADLDGLVRLVDDRTAARDWAGLRATRDRCRAAVATGRQLWPAATLAEYRLALVAPPEWAAPLITDDAGLFTIGPLTEVIAQHHSWAALSPLLPPTPGAALVAHERVLRGEEIDASTVGGLPDVFELPYALAAWEPSYVLATYTDAGVEAPSPPDPASPPTRAERTGTPSDRLDDDAVELAVRQLVDTWTASSNGRAEVACVEGSADDAIASLGPRAWTRRSMSLAEALAWLAWAGASGGAHGRRRGAALGRFGALWVLASLLDLTDGWPVSLDQLGGESDGLHWSWWDVGSASQHGWRLQLAIEDAESGTAWAINAVDAA
jgi:resuscitation-promoting factor RpfA